MAKSQTGRSGNVRKTLKITMGANYFSFASKGLATTAKKLMGISRLV
jgi:hypothetical protein